jgi:hypothetical protein
MLRSALAIVVGYAALAVFIMVAFTLLWLVVGQGRAFAPGTTDVTWAWLAASLPLNLMAAALGGWVAARIAADRPQVAVTGLVMAILVLGFWAAASQGVSVQGDAPPPAPPPDNLGPMEAARLASQPLWVAWVLPILGAVGAWFGGSVRMLQASRTER